MQISDDGPLTWSISRFKLSALLGAIIGQLVGLALALIYLGWQTITGDGVLDFALPFLWGFFISVHGIYFGGLIGLFWSLANVRQLDLALDRSPWAAFFFGGIHLLLLPLWVEIAAEIRLLLLLVWLYVAFVAYQCASLPGAIKRMKVADEQSWWSRFEFLIASAIWAAATWSWLPGMLRTPLTIVKGSFADLT